MMIYRGSNNILMLLDTDSSKLKLIKTIEYIDKETGELMDKGIFELEYKLYDILILPDGQIDCDFTQKYNEAKEELFRIKKEKLKKDSMLKINNDLNMNNNVNNKNQYYYNSRKRVQKPFEELKKEAEESMKTNPNGPWYDSRRNERWGYCQHCNELTKYWVMFDGATNTCRCRECDKKN